MAPLNSKRVAERRRAAAIVRDRRAEIERRFIQMPHANNASDVRKVIKLLWELENAILEVPTEVAEAVVTYPGDFSIEDMQLAEEIIAEQEKNPFEA